MPRIDNEPTSYSHPGWRALYNLTTWIILGISISEGNSIFIGLFMLGCGLLFDYAKTKPVTKFRGISKIAGCFMAVILIIVNLSASFGALTVNSQLDIVVKSFPFFLNETFPVKWYWLIAGISVFITFVDWTAEYSESRSLVVSSVRLEAATGLEDSGAGG